MPHPLVAMFCWALFGCSSLPSSEPAPKPPATEYTVPLLKLDGSVDSLIIEDNRPELGVKILFCKETQVLLICLADEAGRQAWLEIPIAQAPKPDKQT